MIDIRLREKLLEQYKNYGNLIIAFDFDDTVYPYSVNYEDLGQVIHVLRYAKKQGHTLICFTCRHNQLSVSGYCCEQGIGFDYFNDSPVKNESVGLGKIYYNIFLDDKAGLELTTNTLLSVLWDIDKIKETK